MQHVDTIVAISTALGPSAIAIVRMSGPGSEQIAGILFHPAKAVFPLKSHHLTYGWIKDPGSGRVIDEVLCCLMRPPGSYTREEIIEFHTHGGTKTAARIMELCLRHGAELAAPG
ncbi:MAG: tRNA uridine-5-carboxymethylaminomethyl(34) synthesis GTPase MnmE, partial [Deltaproteobacteria bacterium]|nr:tRNA uridine-5-carboxymethylaminomethyl(34) synthesis GTPase MnmE [Deltaproteobacteria bacterium]